jgi:hypothetical protein
MAGGQQAQNGVQFLATALQRGREETPSASLEIYRKYLYLEGDERREAVGPDGRPARGALSAEEVAKVLTAKGKLPLSEYLRCRVRYFCDGAVFGGREYVEGIFKEHRKRFGPKRKSGARRMRGLADASLYTLRALRVRVFGAAGAAGELHGQGG